MLRINLQAACDSPCLGTTSSNYCINAYYFSIQKFNYSGCHKYVPFGFGC